MLLDMLNCLTGIRYFGQLLEQTFDMAETVRNNSRATLRDIAAHAGVSVSTASLVLSGKAKERRISSNVIDRVQLAATTMDYSPNLLIRSLRHGRTHVLSFLNGFRHRSAKDLYMDLLSTAVEQAGGARGYDLLVCCDFRRSDEEMYRHLNGGRSDGLLFFAPMRNDPLLPFLRTSRLPVVLCNKEDDCGLLSSVRDDVADGIRQIADMLVSLGHRRIALLTNTLWGNPDAGERVEMLRARLASQGIRVPETWIIPTDDTTPEDAGAALRFLLAEPEPPTALFCWHDRLGYQILEQCAHLGVSVPEQLSVVGYDGLRWPSTTHHTLASACINLDTLAAAGVDLLDALIQETERGPVKQTIPVTLSCGTTLAPPNI